MNRTYAKTVVASLTAFVLLYYSAAWALLRCCHHDDRIGVHETLSDSDRHDLQGYFSSSSHGVTFIDCLEDVAMHTEILGSAKASPHLQRPTAFTKARAELITIEHGTDGLSKYFQGRVLARGSPHSHYLDTSLYLSLSMLRI